ncbi:MAG: YdcF family protein [Aquabacterium sp.]|nr:YdcF family protein [Aquabacterium sp.]
MDSVIANLGLSGWKPIFAALLLPPFPLLLLMVVGARLMVSRRHWRSGWVVMLSVLLLMWASCCIGVGHFLERALLHVPPPLTESQMAPLRREPQARQTAVVVLGGGRERVAPEYGESHLAPRSMQRLHYGLWLARKLNAPVMFSGGSGHAQVDGPAEADIAARIAARDFGRPLRWAENLSRDTRGNAAASLGLLKTDGISTVVLVTHGWHMRRAQRAFQEAAQQHGMSIQVVSAPMGLAAAEVRPVLRWLPTQEGFTQVQLVLRETLGFWLGA